jgi:two-component system OmpR family sensor kinase
MLAQTESAFRARERSEQRLRRFVADASHELRTPLAAVRAYAELFERGAAMHPEDLCAVDVRDRARVRAHGTSCCSPASTKGDRSRGST